MNAICPPAPHRFPPLPSSVAQTPGRRLRVCLASPEFIGPTRNGGIGTAYTAMAHALRAAGHEVTCLYLEGERVASQTIRYWVDKYKREGLELVPLPPVRTPALDAPHHAVNSFETYVWLKQHDYFDVIHFPEWRGPGYFTVAAKRQGLAFSQSLICIGTHSTTRWVMNANRECLSELADLEKNFMERQSVELADVVVSPSQYLLDYIAQSGWRLPAACYVQQNILPLSARRGDLADSRAPQPITELVFFGRLETRKGLVLFCDALDQLATAHNPQISTVTFLGKEATIDGVSARSYLERRSQRWGWPVQLLTECDQPQAIDYLSKPGRLAVVPSLLENSPYTVLECLGARITFVAARVGGIPELIAPEDVGRVCFEPTPAALAQQLTQALAANFGPAKAAIDAQANERAWVAWHQALPVTTHQPATVTELTVLPKVSVCLVTYNRPKLLAQALDSLQAMEYPNLEVVLVDDGSTAPDAVAALERWEPALTQRGWKLVRQPNRYLGAARNTAARHATGEYLLFMDDDNFAEPHEVSILVQAAERTGADIVSCGMNYFSGQEAPNLKSLPKSRWLPLGGATAAGALRNCFGDANALVRRTCFESLGGFTEDYGVTHEDWEFHAKAVLKGFRLIVVPEFLFWYRVNSDSMIRTLARYPNYMRSIRPYVEAVPEGVRDLIYFAQAQHLQLTRTLGARLPDANEIRLTIAWRSKLEAARALIARNDPTTAMQLLMAAVNSLQNSSYPLVVLEALMELGLEMRPLNQEGAEKLLRLALDLAKAIKSEELEVRVSNLLATFKSPQALSQSPVHSKAAVVRELAPSLSVNLPALQACSSTEPGPGGSVSIIIPVFNNLALTQACLLALNTVRSASRCEIVVVDNASTDGTREFLQAEQQAGRLRLLLNPSNEGFARACNRGAQMARGSFLLFLNNDTRVLPGWLEALIAAASQPGVGIVGAKLLYADNSIQHAGIEFINGVPDHPYRHAPADAPEANRFRELDMVTGACLLIERELFLKLEGFDEVYRNGVEDVDLCLRVRAAGKKVVYEPKAVVYHLEGQSVGRFNHVQENLQRFFKRWAGAFDSQRRFRVPAVPQLVAAERSLLGENGEAARAKPVEVAWEGTFLDFGSLSHVNREFTRHLAQLPQVCVSRVGRADPHNGYAAYPELAALAGQLLPVPPLNTAITVRHAWPPDWRPPGRGALVVIQPWEFGALPEEWVRLSAQVQEFWVPSTYVRQVYVDSGIPMEKVRVVPNGIDPERFHPGVPPMKLPTQKTYKFLFVGGTIHRKGPDVLLEAYLRSFKATDDVCLVVKDFGGKSVYAGQTLEQQIKAARALPNAPEILYLTDELPPEELPGLYAACDCLVHPYRGEGFGLPILEAMACGLPVIVTSGGAADDFVDESFAYRIPSVRKSIGESISGIKLVSLGWLLEPDAAALADRMKWVFAHRDEARTKGKAASEVARRDWTWKRAAEMAAARLSELGKLALSAPAAVAPQSIPESKRLPACAQLGELGKARELCGQKKHQEAWEFTLAALRLRPCHPEGYLLLAQIAQQVGGYTAARSCAEQAQRLAPEWKSARRFLKGCPNGGKRPPTWLVVPQEIRSPAANHQPRLSVCLITKNEEKFLPQCLASIRELAQQVVVVDTGSTDRTVEIAKEHGAEVHHFTWCDDFSAARNAALEQATGDWVLMLDADEELPPESHHKLRKLLQASSVMAWRLPIIDVGREAEGCCYVPRLFRNAPGLFYTGRIHEQVFGSVEACRQAWGLENRLGDAALRHHGYRPEVAKDRNKVQRNLQLLEKALQETPADANLLMNYGLELVRSGNAAAGLEQYRRAFQFMSVNPAAVPAEMREMLLTQFATQLMAGKGFTELVCVLTSPLAKAGGLTASLHFSLGLAYTELKDYPAAAEQMRQCIAKRHQSSLAPINPEIRKAGPQHCLAVCLGRAGQVEAARKAFAQALHEEPQSRPIRLDYAEFMAAQGQPVEALQLFHALATEQPQDPQAWRLGGQLALSRPEFLEVALDWSATAQGQLPEDRVLLRQRAEALTLTGQCAAALPLWQQLYSAPDPETLAPLVLCESVAGLPQQSPEARFESQTSGIFLKWYQRLLQYKAGEAVQQVNQKLDQLEKVLPSATKLLRAALQEAAV